MSSRKLKSRIQKGHVVGRDAVHTLHSHPSEELNKSGTEMFLALSPVFHFLHQLIFNFVCHWMLGRLFVLAGELRAAAQPFTQARFCQSPEAKTSCVEVYSWLLI